MLPRHRRFAPLDFHRATFDPVLVGDPDGSPVEGDIAGPREVEDVLVARVQVPAGLQRLVVADGEVAREPGRSPREVPVDRDRLHPMDDVLEAKPPADLAGDVPREPRVGRGRPEVQEERAVGREDPVDHVRGGPDPPEVLRPEGGRRRTAP